MKRIIALVALSLLIVSCGGFSEDDFVGEWKVVEFEVESDKLDPEIVEMGKQEALKTSYSFKEDRTCIIKWGSGSEYESEVNWEYHEDEQVLSFSVGATITDFQIEHSGSDQITWSEDMGELGTSRLTIERQ